MYESIDKHRATLLAERDALTAEVERLAEALRAEVERLRADRDSWEQQASDRVADWYAEHLRAEQLEEALKKVAQSLEWYAHGRCRGFGDEAPLPTNEAVELAERTLAKALGHDDTATADGENMTLHTCSYECQRAECIKAQRDELRARVESDKALMRKVLEALELHATHHERGCVYLDPSITALRERLWEKKT